MGSFGRRALRKFLVGGPEECGRCDSDVQRRPKDERGRNGKLGSALPAEDEDGACAGVGSGVPYERTEKRIFNGESRKVFVELEHFAMGENSEQFLERFDRFVAELAQRKAQSLGDKTDI